MREEVLSSVEDEKGVELHRYKFRREFLVLKKIFEKLKDDFDISSTELFNMLEQKDIFIPICVFNDKLSGLETIVKFLKENFGLSHQEIAILTNRSIRTIRQAYEFAKVKKVDSFKIKSSKYHFPLSVLRNRELSVFENIVLYLKTNYEIKLVEIAKVLARNPKTIWTVYSRAVKKVDQK